MQAIMNYFPVPPPFSEILDPPVHTHTHARIDFSPNLYQRTYLVSCTFFAYTVLARLIYPTMENTIKESFNLQPGVSRLNSYRL